MDVPVSASEPVREIAASFQCGLCDKEVVHKIAHVLLLGLATASVDNTTGDLFRGPGSVAVEIRKEMVNYLTSRSESFVAETVVQEGEQVPEVPDHPTEIISDFAEDFAATKRNILGRVSGWLLSESREDKIDDFVQEMDTNGFWFMERREAVAESLLKNVDFKNEYHCKMRFDTYEQLKEHKEQCAFRLVSCTNEGCKTTFCAVHAEKHDMACPYKYLQCEQKCPQTLMRREMDRHCITVCPMKLVNCPFYQIGCQSTVPRCLIEQHCEEFIHFHLLFVLQATRKLDKVTDELKEHALLLEKSQSENELSKALDVRSLTLAIKEQEAKIKKQEADHEKSQSQEESIENDQQMSPESA